MPALLQPQTLILTGKAPRADRQAAKAKQRAARVKKAVPAVAAAPAPAPVAVAGPAPGAAPAAIPSPDSHLPTYIPGEKTMTAMATQRLLAMDATSMPAAEREALETELRVSLASLAAEDMLQEQAFRAEIAKSGLTPEQLNTPQPSGVLYLNTAVSRRWYDAVDHLLLLGADPEARDELGTSALRQARANRDNRMINLLKRRISASPPPR